MGVDEAMLERAAEGPTLLRFYGWEPWCLSLGRHQSAPARLLGRPRAALRVGVDVVRRPTGGRAVFHGPELTYAFACPARAWGGPRAVLRALRDALAEGLRSLGVPLDGLADREGPANPDAGVSRPRGEALAITAAACFRDAAPGELTVRGRKLVGSAQCRRRGALLQHGSILLEDRQSLGDLEGPVDGRRGAIGLAEILELVPSRRVIAQGLAPVVARRFGGPGPRIVAASVVSSFARRTAAFETVHSSAAWLWRRSTRIALDDPVGHL